MLFFIQDVDQWVRKWSAVLTFGLPSLGLAFVLHPHFFYSGIVLQYQETRSLYNWKIRTSHFLTFFYLNKVERGTAFCRDLWHTHFAWPSYTENLIDNNYPLPFIRRRNYTEKILPLDQSPAFIKFVCSSITFVPSWENTSTYMLMVARSSECECQQILSTARYDYS